MEGQLNLFWTAEDEKKKQEEIAKHYNLSHWYGTNCIKCCGVYPRFIKTDDDKCYYECQVCGRKSEAFLMPWLARNDWDRKMRGEEDDDS